MNESVVFIEGDEMKGGDHMNGRKVLID